MIKNLTYILLVSAGVTASLQAQQTSIYTSDFVDFQKALALYNNSQYNAAQALFRDIKKETKDESIESDCAFYIANCAVRTGKFGAEQLVEDFVEAYPTSTKRNNAFVDVAHYYFNKGEYARARKWYDKVDENALAKADREQYNFNNGYSAFVSKQQGVAKTFLKRVENSEKYGSQAKYYIGFMEYQKDDYNSANEYFEQVKDKEKYKKKLSYYQADLNFKLGKFEKAIELAKEQLPESDYDEVSQLNKIIGESYFNLEKYEEAIPYLKEYEGENGKWSNTDYYQLGYAYYKQKDYETAVSEFSKIIGGRDAVAQNAYYHLGESYSYLEKKQEALNAFKNASEMDFDPKIQEDAYLNYAKISYEIGNPYKPVPAVLTGYLNKYPNTEHKDEIETLLIDSYITSRNYKEAIALLEKKKTDANKPAYQKVTFYRGVELFTEGDYQDALVHFDKSLSEPINDEFTARSTYWKAESNYNLGNFADALSGFKQFQQLSNVVTTPEKQNVDYNIGYTLFKLKQYPESTQYFSQFASTATNDKARQYDAYLRLGDANFVSSNYSSAVSAYDKATAIGAKETDYPFFQKALSAGYTGQINQKTKSLEEFIKRYPKSKLRDDAIYELANTYVKSGNTDRAMQLYDQLASEYRASQFVPKGLLRQGLAYYNNSQNEQALGKFKTVANKFPGTPEAKQAVATARLIYIDLGRVDDYAAWVKTLDYVEVTDADLDNDTYQSAEKQYLDNNTNAAIKQFNKYLNEFPNGLHALNAHFYLAQLYFKKDDKQQAAPHYQYIVNAPQSEYTEEALQRYSQILLEDKNWRSAIPVLKRLETEANHPQNVVFAQSNLMKAHYQLNNYQDAVAYAEAVLKQSTIDNKIKSDANVIIARSAMQTGDEDKARQAYTKVEQTAKGKVAAEALYYKAYFQHQDGDFETSNATVQRLAKNYSSYKYYSAKGLIVMAKNFNALGDAFQATYILESVIKNFAEFPDVTSEAQRELNNIKTEQAKTNSSIKTDD